MASHQARLYHAGRRGARTLDFADANRARDPRVFSGLFEHMLLRRTAVSSQNGRRGAADRFYRACIWPASVRNGRAVFREVFGAKTHVVYDPDLGRPSITP